MSGHSKWHSIKHKKGAIDAKRGRAFSKLIKELTVAARGGGDPFGNPRLRKAMDDAKGLNMPKDTMMNAIKRGTGEIAGAAIEDITYEGYGPGGVAVFVECQTDNRVRTVAEVRHIFAKHGGNLGESGSVAWMFQKKGAILIEKSVADEEKMMELALEAGAEDVSGDDETWEVITSPEDQLFPAALIKAGAAQLRDARVVEIDGAGHSSYFERANEFNDALLAFLA